MGILTELGRRFHLFCHKPRHWTLRPGTIDRRLFRQVVIQNEYRLPSRFDGRDTIVDIGSHIGSFAYAVLRRGAGAVWCCEPDADNFHLLEHNLAPYNPRVHLIEAAIWRSDQSVSHLALHNPEDDPRNTSAYQVADAPSGSRVRGVAFDDLIDRATGGGARRVRLLKLDCEGSEWPILLTSRRLHLIDAIHGEYHRTPCSGLFGVAGHAEYTPALLERYLAQQGFRVQILPDPKGPQRIGLFFAERANAKDAHAAA